MGFKRGGSMSDNSAKEQASVAKVVLGFGGGAILLLLLMAGISELVLVFSIDQITTENRDMYLFIKDLLNNIVNATLPLIGVWVGAVISYYFGKANFEAASKSVADALQSNNAAINRLAQKKLFDYMVKYDDKLFTLKTTMTVREAKDSITKYNKNNPDVYRLPVLDGETKIPVAYLELNDLEKYFTTAPDKTIGDVANDKDLASYSHTSFRLIALSKSMQEASVAINQPGVCILFITENGNQKEDLKGIITAKDIARSMV